MQIIYDSKGRPFDLLISVCQDKDYYAYKAAVEIAVLNTQNGFSGQHFEIIGRDTAVHAIFPPCRIVPGVTKSLVTGLEIITLGCHTFTGTNMQTLLAWLKG